MQSAAAHVPGRTEEQEEEGKISSAAEKWGPIPRGVLLGVTEGDVGW